MNIVLIVNSLNLPDIQAFITAASTLQVDKANGALVVVYQQSLGKESIESLLAPLLPKFSANGAIPASINAQYDNDGRNASLFCFFISQGYARFPGPWLVVDGPGVPTVENFMQALERQHGGLGGTCSGRFSAEGSAQVPIGPVVIGVPVSQLSWFTQGGTESWRVSMRFMLARCGFKTVPLDEYLFSLPSAISASPEGTRTPAAPAAPPAEPPASPSSPPVFDASSLDQPEPEVQECASPQGDGEPRKDPLPEEVPHSYEDLDREALFDLIEARGLDKPHHSTGAPKLIAILVEDDASGDHHQIVEDLRNESNQA